MAGGFIHSSGSMGTTYEGQTTTYVVLACLMAACGGLMLGYHIGVSGGVTSMDDFLEEFFPNVYKAHRNSSNNYGQYNNQALQAFTSSLYLTGMLASLTAPITNRRWGRKSSIFIGGATFLIGAILNAAAQNVAMFILGRMCLGTGIGFACQAVPLYLSKIAPPDLRGTLNIMFQLIIANSILSANLVNYGMGKVTPWGWRVSLGIAAIPGAVVTLGCLFLPHAPNSLLQQDGTEEARKVLEKNRGTSHVHKEFNDMTQATEVNLVVRHPYRNLFRKKYVPNVVVGTFIPFFNQMTAINAIMFYAPVLFKTMGFGSNAALYSAVVVGAVNVLSILVAAVVVDKWDHKTLFYQSRIQMSVSLIAVGVILEYDLGLHGQLSKTLGIVVVVLICSFVSSFAWSWGPILFLNPMMENLGLSLAAGMNRFWPFAIAQSLLTLLCVMKYGIFLFFGGWVALVTLTKWCICSKITGSGEGFCL